MKRILVVLGVCAFLFGCRPGGNGSNGSNLPNPLSGTWSEIESSFSGDELPFGLADVDPDAVFELINQGFSGGVRHIELQGLSELLPGALTGSLADVLADIGLDAAEFQEALGGIDLAGALEWLVDNLGPVADFFLGLFGLGSAEDLLADLGDLQALVDGVTGGLDALLAQLPDLGGSLPDSASCTLAVSQLTCGALACGDLSCEPISHIVDLRPGVDAVLTLSVDVSGSFQGSSNAQLYVTVDATCVGPDCAAILDQLPVELPFTYSLAANDL